MSKIENFHIALQKPDNLAVYVPGDVLIGILNFRVVERVSIKNVRLVIDGSARVKWAEGKGKKKKLYGSVDTYLRDKKVFLEKSDEAEFFLELGEYSFPFKFSLPLNLPSSFEYENARIRYSLNASIDMPPDHKHVIRIFTIVNHFDLNSLPNLKKPTEATDSNTVKCWGPFSRGTITGELNVRKTGYVPGETIVCQARLNNRSSREAKPMTVSLVQQIFCHGRRFASQIKQIERDVVVSKFPRSAAPRSHLEWNDIRLLVPPICPSTSPSESRAIEIFYALVLRYQTVGMKACKEVSIPIVIGTKPILNSSSSSHSLVSASIFLYQPSIFEPPISELLPSEYDDNIKDDVQSNSNAYRPFYPYYGGLAK